MPDRSPDSPAKKAVKPDVETQPVPPTVGPARRKRRHVFLIVSLIWVVFVPAAISAYYLWGLAADQYASRIAFSVRSEEQRSPIELLGGITDLSGSSSSDTDILYVYLNSQELVAKVNERVNLARIWSKVSTEQDPVFAYDPHGTIEDLHRHWERKVDIIYDSGTQLIEMRFLAFEPDDARAIAEAVLAESTAMINNLSALAREDAVGYAREDLETALARLRVARQALTLFRNRTQIVDPTIDTQNQMGVLVTLQQQLADALVEGDLLRDTTSEGDSRIAQANRRVEVIQNRIDAERQKLGLGNEGEGGVVFADLVGEYEGLIVDREFAEVAYTTALASFDGAQAEARRQSRYLAAHVQPTLAQKAQYPERLKLMLLIALFCTLTWCVLCLVYYSLRDRR
ncbi:MAG TPA: capsule biosynthesis protein [Octadecabacter sp.]|nr:capsule biosynthesis protein [Octadecabacter sp.]